MKKTQFIKFIALALFFLINIIGCAERSPESGDAGVTTPVTFAFKVPSGGNQLSKAFASAPSTMTVELNVTNGLNEQIASSIVTAVSGETVTTTLNVLSGPDRLFKAIARNTTGVALFEGTSEPTTLDGQPVSISIPMKVVEVSVPTIVVGTVKHDIHLSEEDFSFFNGVSGDFDGAMFFSGSAPEIPSTTVRDVAGFLAQKTALNGETNSNDIFGSMIALMNADTNILSVSATGTQSSTAPDSFVTNLELTHDSPIKPTTLANKLLTLFAINKVGGSVTNLPVPIAGEISATQFTVVISVIFFDANDVLYLLALVPSEKAVTYAHITSNVTSNSNVTAREATIIPGKDTFTAQGGGGLADFLFVIDNSGSMSAEQTAISEAATAFENAILNSGLDFQIGTITTDSDTLRDTSADGGFTNSIAEFKLDIQPGTGGSGNERGIFFSEKALSPDGTVQMESFPRAGASLSVVIMSDEPSHYTSRFLGVKFAPNNNLFIDNGYRVYSIIEPADNTLSQYDDLAQTTGGSEADIGNTAVFPVIMNNIALNAGGATSRFVLSQLPVAATIAVLVNGVSVANSQVDGWTFNLSANTIFFHGSAIPSAGETISVTYGTIASSLGTSE